MLQDEIDQVRRRLEPDFGQDAPGLAAMMVSELRASFAEPDGKDRLSYQAALARLPRGSTVWPQPIRNMHKAAGMTIRWQGKTWCFDSAQRFANSADADEYATEFRLRLAEMCLP